jgi:hypothetical protein
MPNRVVLCYAVGLKVRDQGFNPKMAGEIPASMPEWLVDLLVQCWNVDPSERPTMRKVAATIKKHREEAQSPPVSPR